MPGPPDAAVKAPRQSVDSMSVAVVERMALVRAQAASLSGRESNFYVTKINHRGRRQLRALSVGDTALLNMRPRGRGALPNLRALAAAPIAAHYLSGGMASLFRVTRAMGYLQIEDIALLNPGVLLVTFGGRVKRYETPLAPTIARLLQQAQSRMRELHRLEQLLSELSSGDAVDGGADSMPERRSSDAGSVRGGSAAKRVAATPTSPPMSKWSVAELVGAIRRVAVSSGGGAADSAGGSGDGSDSPPSGASAPGSGSDGRPLEGAAGAEAAAMARIAAAVQALLYDSATPYSRTRNKFIAVDFLRAAAETAAAVEAAQLDAAPTHAALGGPAAAKSASATEPPLPPLCASFSDDDDDDDDDPGGESRDDAALAVTAAPPRSALSPPPLALDAASSSVATSPPRIDGRSLPAFVSPVAAAGPPPIAAPPHPAAAATASSASASDAPHPAAAASLPPPLSPSSAAALLSASLVANSLSLDGPLLSQSDRGSPPRTARSVLLAADLPLFVALREASALITAHVLAKRRELLEPLRGPLSWGAADLEATAATASGSGSCSDDGRAPSSSSPVGSDESGAAACGPPFPNATLLAAMLPAGSIPIPSLTSLPVAVAVGAASDAAAASASAPAASSRASSASVTSAGSAACAAVAPCENAALLAATPRDLLACPWYTGTLLNAAADVFAAAVLEPPSVRAVIRREVDAALWNVEPVRRADLEAIRGTQRAGANARIREKLRRLRAGGVFAAFTSLGLLAALPWLPADTHFLAGAAAELRAVDSGACPRDKLDAVLGSVVAVHKSYARLRAQQALQQQLLAPRVDGAAAGAAAAAVAPDPASGGGGGGDAAGVVGAACSGRLLSGCSAHGVHAHEAAHARRAAALAALVPPLLADELLPLFIATLLKSRLVDPAPLPALLRAVADPATLSGADGYYLTMLEAALEFIDAQEV